MNQKLIETLQKMTKWFERGTRSQRVKKGIRKAKVEKGLEEDQNDKWGVDLPANEPMPVVAYVRATTKTSIEQQIAILKDYAKGHNIHIVKTFIDQGANNQQDAFWKMMSEFRKGKTPFLLIEDLNRLPRSIKIHEIFHMLDRINVFIITSEGGTTMLSESDYLKVPLK